MKLKRIIALLSAAVIILSCTSGCGKKDANEAEETTSETISETTTETVTSNYKTYYVKTNDGYGINLRSGPGTDSAVVTSVPEGTMLTVTEEKEGWGKTVFGNYSGWVSMNYLVKSAPAVTEKSSQSETVTKSSYPYSYAGYNPKTVKIPEDTEKWYLMLVNRNYILPEGYKPKLAEAVKGSGSYLDEKVAPYYQKMYDAAKADGVNLTPCSGYRSYDTQKTNFENKISFYTSQGYDKTTATQNAARVILPPGTSEHNAGLAMDVGWVTEDFENSSAYTWLDAHAQDYGFILRYPKDEAKQKITEIVYEPWHWRFVGVKAAKEIKKSGQVLEEYLGIK